MDLKIKLASFSKQTKRLEAAYIKLQKQFYDLKAKLESSHQTIEQIITYMTDGLIFITQEGVITLFNAAAAAMLGIEQKKILYALYETHFTDRFFGFSMKEACQRPFMHQRIFISLQDGRDLEISTSIVPKKGIVLLLTDRTEQQKLQKSLHQSDRLKEIGEMAATLAHEIRNPLGGIEGFAQLLKRDIEVPSQRNMVQAILEGTGALNRLVSEVLEYACPLDLHFAPVDLILLIRETLALITVCQFKTQYLFITAYREFFLSIDRDKIQRVIFNLLKNASEAEATLVEVTLTQEGVLQIQDNGKGIIAKNLEKIFTPFFTTKTRGSGLGLAHSLAIIRAHDGILEIASQEDQGTEINIKL